MFVSSWLTVIYSPHLRQLILRLSRLGVREDMPPDEAKHVQLINQIAMVAMAVLLIFAPLEFGLGHPASD